jgi:hypothetical protein
MFGSSHGIEGFGRAEDIQLLTLLLLAPKSSG